MLRYCVPSEEIVCVMPKGFWETSQMPAQANKRVFVVIIAMMMMRGDDNNNSSSRERVLL